MSTAAIFFVFYLILVLALAILGMRKVKDMSTYAIGNKEMGPVLCAIVWAATMSSAGSFMGVSGQMYSNGLSVLWYQLALGFCIPIGFAFFGKGYRRVSQKKKSLSTPDWIADRYNSEFLRVFLGITATLQVTYVASQFIGVGIILQEIFNIPYLYGALLGVAIVVGYIFAGGTYAHVYTNIFQGLLMLAAAIFVFSLGFKFFPNLFSDLPDQLAGIDARLVDPLNPKDVAFNTPFAIVGIFVAHLLWGLNPHQVNKVQYLKSNRDLKKFFLLSGLFGVILSLTTWSGLYARVLTPNLEKADHAVVSLVTFAFNPLVSALFLTVFIAAAMSTTDGLLVYLSTVYGNTLYKKSYIRWKESKGAKYDPVEADKTALRISRYSLLFICALALPMIVSQPKFLNVLLWVGNGGVLSSFAGPILFGVYSRKAGKTAAIISSVTGFFGYLIIYFSGIVPSVYAATGCGMVLGIVTMAIAVKLTKPMPSEESDDWFASDEESAPAAETPG